MNTEILISEEKVQKRIQEIAEEIKKDYQEGDAALDARIVYLEQTIVTINNSIKIFAKIPILIYKT